MPSKKKMLLRRSGLDGMEPAPSSKEIRNRIAAGGPNFRVKVPKKYEPAIEVNIVLRSKEAMP